jgi:hypothetical protein
MEVKQITGEEALGRAEARLVQSAESAKRQIDEQAKETIRHMRDAAAGIEALETGIGTLVDRAVGLFVATFEIRGFAPGDRLSISGAELNFPRHGYRVTLDADAFRGSSEDLRPCLESGRRYRAVVLLEPVD